MASQRVRGKRPETEVPMRWFALTFTWCCTCAFAGAQATSSAFVTQTLTAVSSSTGSQTFPPGPVPSSGVRVETSPQNTIRAALGVLPASPGSGNTFPAGTTGWTVGGGVHIAFGFCCNATASTSGRVLLHFASPQAVSGLLYLQPNFTHYPTLQTLQGDVTVDIDVNGVPDYATRTQFQQGVPIPVTLGPAGMTIGVDIAMSGSWWYNGTNSVSGEAAATWTIVFLPGTYGFEQFGTGCHPAIIARTSAWGPAFGCRLPTANPVTIVMGFFLVGLAPQNTPHPHPPNCPLLVASPVVVTPTVLYPRSIWLYPPDIALPPGLQFYGQAIWLNTLGEVITSDSVRTM